MTDNILSGRIRSIDAFRGFTVLAMIFVIQVAGYSNLPLTMSWFGSAPVSTFHHAGTAGSGIGLTFTDLVAPFFVFIVGLVLPISQKRRGRDWWRHVGARTGLLILLGILYISLILHISYWWGILQSIGVAYFMGAAAMLLRVRWRWIALFAIAGLHLLLTHSVGWWSQIGDPEAAFLTITNLTGDPLRPLNIHCTPWASISYGLITIAGTILGEAFVDRTHRKVITKSLLLGVILTGIGYVLHRLNWPVFAMDKETVSASYSLTSAGISALTFLAFYLIIEVWEKSRWAWPLVVFGTNALLGYFLQPVVRNFVYALGFQPYLTGHSGWMGMYYGLLWTALLWVIVYWFNHRNIYWKI